MTDTISSTDYYRQCTVQNSSQAKNLLGTWRIKTPRSRRNYKHNQYVRVGRFANFLTGVYIICDSTDEQIKMSISFDDLDIDLPTHIVSFNELTESISTGGSSISDKNCLPEPLPIDNLVFSYICVNIKYANRADLITDCKILFTYDYCDVNAILNVEKTITWNNTIAINAGCARLL